MKKLVLAALILFVTSSLPAQEYIDVVHLKNGGLIKGIIIENVPNDKVKIKTRDGSIFVFKYSEIEKFTKEENQKTEKIDKKDDKNANKMLYDELEKSQALGCLFTLFVPGGQHYYAKEYVTGTMYLTLFVGAYTSMIINANKFSKANDTYKSTVNPSDKQKADKYAKYTVYSIYALLGIKLVDVLHGFYSIDNYNDMLKEKFKITSGTQKIYLNTYTAYDDIYKEQRYNLGLTMTF